jgi:hypothetical protein
MKIIEKIQPVIGNDDSGEQPEPNRLTKSVLLFRNSDCAIQELVAAAMPIATSGREQSCNL